MSVGPPQGTWELSQGSVRLHEDRIGPVMLSEARQHWTCDVLRNGMKLAYEAPWGSVVTCHIMLLLSWQYVKGVVIDVESAQLPVQAPSREL